MEVKQPGLKWPKGKTSYGQNCQGGKGLLQSGWEDMEFNLKK